MSTNNSYLEVVRRPEPFYFKYPHHNLDFADWISVFTLCLAPLVAHIFVGAPQPVALSGKGPRWYDRMLLLNPTTIYWRYYAIRYRRARKLKSWEGEETAATSAIFWVNDKEKWDGSEEFITKSKEFLANGPSAKKFIPPLSISALQTLLVTLQGVQTLYILGKGIHLGGFALVVSLASIFQPLAIAGLFRLPSAAFLTNDFHYRNIEPQGDVPHQEMGVQVKSTSASAVPAPCPLFTTVATPLATPIPSMRPESSPATPLPENSELLLKQHDPRATFWEVLFLSATAGLLGLASWYFKPNPLITAGPYSTLLINVFYVFFLLVTLTITFFYTVRYQNNTTIIPCIESDFYMAYTCILFTLAILVTIITALETRKTACGVYTTYAGSLGWDYYVCPNSSSL